MRRTIGTLDTGMGQGLGLDGVWWWCKFSVFGVGWWGGAVSLRNALYEVEQLGDQRGCFQVCGFITLCGLRQVRLDTVRLARQSAVDKFVEKQGTGGLRSGKARLCKKSATKTRLHTRVVGFESQYWGVAV